MAKGLLAGLKGVDAFGKVTTFRFGSKCPLIQLGLVDYRRCEGQDSHRRIM
jgi:hypothetical protein